MISQAQILIDILNEKLTPEDISGLPPDARIQLIGLLTYWAARVSNIEKLYSYSRKIKGKE